MTRAFSLARPVGKRPLGGVSARVGNAWKGLAGGGGTPGLGIPEVPTTLFQLTGESTQAITLDLPSEGLSPGDDMTVFLMAGFYAADPTITGWAKTVAQSWDSSTPRCSAYNPFGGLADPVPETLEFNLNAPNGTSFIACSYPGYSVKSLTSARNNLTTTLTPTSYAFTPGDIVIQVTGTQRAVAEDEAWGYPEEFQAIFADLRGEVGSFYNAIMTYEYVETGHVRRAHTFPVAVPMVQATLVLTPEA